MSSAQRTPSTYGAIVLFTDRARAADHRFTLTDENAPIVAEICRRLDGIPLAIELAAARVNHVIGESARGELDDRFRILTGGERRRCRDSRRCARRSIGVTICYLRRSSVSSNGSRSSPAAARWRRRRRLREMKIRGRRLRLALIAGRQVARGGRSRGVSRDIGS